jgi:hypothetical protein
MTDLLARPLPKGDALLHRGRQGPGELGVKNQRSFVLHSLLD